MEFLCQDDPIITMESFQASTNQLATLLYFTITFDLIKMKNPNIQNDFSYYRRTVSRMKSKNQSEKTIVQDEVANKMSLFFAHSNPVMKSCIDSLSTLIIMVYYD
jgi:hypothetical protein